MVSMLLPSHRPLRCRPTRQFAGCLCPPDLGQQCSSSSRCGCELWRATGKRVEGRNEREMKRRCRNESEKYEKLVKWYRVPNESYLHLFRSGIAHRRRKDRHQCTRSIQNAFLENGHMLVDPNVQRHIVVFGPSSCGRLRVREEGRRRDGERERERRRKRESNRLANRLVVKCSIDRQASG